MCNRYAADIRKAGKERDYYGFDEWSETRINPVLGNAALEVFPKSFGPVLEEAAVALVRAHYSEDKYEVQDKQKERCNFDLLVRPRDAPHKELHIEVKGTQNVSPHFLMSQGEYAYMHANPRHWRLAMVTSALSNEPRLEVLKADEVEERFFWKEFTWHATAKP